MGEAAKIVQNLETVAERLEELYRDELQTKLREVLRGRSTSGSWNPEDLEVVPLNYRGEISKGIFLPKDLSFLVRYMLECERTIIGHVFPFRRLALTSDPTIEGVMKDVLRPMGYEVQRFSSMDWLSVSKYVQREQSDKVKA